MFNQDSYLAIGDSHSVCQDYCIAKPLFIVLADGCSGTNFSDYGSRILTLNAINNEKSFNDTQLFAKNVFDSSNLIVQNLNLNLDCLCATLLACKANQESFDVFVSGDGVIVAEDLDGNFHVYDYSYSSNAPYYLLYSLNSSIKQQYLDNFDQFHTLKYHKYEKNTFNILDSNVQDIKIDDQFITHKFPFSSFVSVTLFSDGINSFTHKGKIYNNQNVIKDLFNFKSYNGSFISRRCKRQFSSFKENEISHYDDFSIASIRII